MTDKVTTIGGRTLLDLPADRVLGAAVGKLDAVVVIGRTYDGELYCASSSGDAAEVAWLLERGKRATFDAVGA